MVNFKGTNLYCYVDQIISPSDYESFDKFMEEVNQRFTTNYLKVQEYSNEKKRN